MMEEFSETDSAGEDFEIAGLLQEVSDVLAFSERRDQEVLSHFCQGAVIATGRNSNFKSAGKNMFLTEDELRKNGIRYRLRFLNAALYAGEVPHEVISLVKKFEHIRNGATAELYILAPVSFFLLENQYNDPLLFCKTGDGRYKLLCRWGSCIPWYREIVRYPYRDFKSMVISALLIGIAVALFTGFAGFYNDPNLMKSLLFKIPVVILSAGAFSTAALCYGLVTYTDFSEDNWNSRYFN